ncbi:WAP four-disulfide core domain protein 5-like [Mytilus californianus]|uniref:WAP four-disulfide core domain protein 5-like n=1 Tax=Mytilus californianus TaxID=6549 RepID=UPI002246E8BA|nr:WAP four-disulfide core domain protein 5-like [Mytilus californianus]XP_052070474.1 WAP four-disulfide core domain protein 5-like [Mytilus californianus]
MWSIWIVLLSFCHYGYTQTVHGVCPPLVNPITDCSLAKISSNCFGEDSDCEDGMKCCPTDCGSNNCKNPLLIQLPGCPVDDFVCFRYQQLCNSDQDCNTGQMCCYNPSCGTSCKEKVKKILAPDVNSI